MKQKFTLNIADIQISVIADAAPDEVEHIRGLLDRKMREIYVKSRCPKTEAALLCAMDFAADRMNLQNQITELDERCDKYAIVLENLKERNADQSAELERLRSENAVLRSLLTKQKEEEAAAEEESVALDPISPAAFFAEVAEAQTQNAALFEATRVSQDESVDDYLYEDEDEDDLAPEAEEISAPAVEEPVAIEEPEAVEDEPAEEIPVRSEPIQAEPVKVEPVKTEPVKASPIRVEIGRSSAKPAAAKPAETKSESVKPADEPTPRPRSRVGNMFRHLSFGDVD